MNLKFFLKVYTFLYVSYSIQPLLSLNQTTHYFIHIFHPYPYLDESGGWLQQHRCWCVYVEVWQRLCHKQWHPSVPLGCVRLTLAVIVGLIPRPGTATQRKCLFSLTDLNAIWLSVANSVVLIPEMISPEDFKKEGSKDSYFIQHSSTSCCSAGGLTATVSNWPRCDWLCREGISLLPTKTHTSLDVTGSLGDHAHLWYNSRQLLYLEKVEQSWEKFLSSGAFFLGLQTLTLNKVTLHDWREGIRGSFSQNLNVLPVLKLSVKPNKPFECLNKEDSIKKKKRKHC